MGFRSKIHLKRQLGTWHGCATSSTGRANLLENASKGGIGIEHGRSCGGTGHAKLLAMAFDLKL